MLVAVTIKDIAQMAGVSITTVSKIINKKDSDISDKTRDKVLKIIDEYNFTPNALATGLVTKKTNTIGLLVPDISNAFFAELARGVEDGANCEGYNVILCNTDENPEKEVEYLDVLRAKNVDGIIFLSAALSNHDAVADLNQKGVPLVVLDRTIEEENVMMVCLDNVNGGYIATKHLLEYGHEKIGCITGPLKNDIAKHRFRGYVKALKEMNMGFLANFIYEGDFKTKSGEKGAEALIKAGVTAIFACNDMMAYGAYKKIQEQGIKIPDEISVVGFDDIYMSEILTPPLTSVKQPAHEMGLMSAAMLIKGIKGKALEKTQMEFRPTLSMRKSVGPPPNS